MTVSPATVLKCDGGADGGTKCERRFVSFADMFVCKDDIKRLKKRGWTQVSARHYCPECSIDHDRRKGKRPQYRGPKKRDDYGRQNEAPEGRTHHAEGLQHGAPAPPCGRG